MAEEEVWVKLQPQLLRKRHFECKLSLNSHFKSVSETIKECLNDAEMQNMIDGTQFGNLIKYAGDYNLSSQIIWFLMVRQSCKTASNEMWMVVNQRPLRFSKMEYALITGLDCLEDFPEVIETTQFQDRHFGGNEIIHIEDVAVKLNEKRSTPEGTIDLEKLKLSCLYFVAAVLWPSRQKTDTQVDSMLMSLVEDLDLFNKYPWGTIAYKEVLKSLKRDLTVTKLKKQRKKDKDVECGTFSLSGFVHPLQILAYECIPGIAQEFAKPRNGYNMLLPRMCRWISNDWHVKSSPKYNEVVKVSHGSNRVVIGVLIPTEVELQASYIVNGRFDESEPHLSIIVPLLSERQNVYCHSDNSAYSDRPTKVDAKVKKHEPLLETQKMDMHVDQSPPFRKEESRQHTEAPIDQSTFAGDVPNISKYFAQLRDYIDEKFMKLQAYVDERFTKIEGKLQEESAHVRRQGKAPVETPHQPTSILPEAKRQKIFDSKYLDEEVMPSEGSTSPQVGYSLIQTNSPILHTPQCVIMNEGAFDAHPNGDALHEGASNAHPIENVGDNCDKKSSKDISLKYVRAKRQIKKSSYLSSPFTEFLETPSVLTRDQLVPYNGTFQPLQIANSSELIAHLKKQIRTIQGSRQYLTSYYDKKWFNNLLLPTSWLGSSHIDECMNGFLILQKNYPLLVAQDIAIMGGYFSGLLDDVHSKEEKGLSHCHWETLIQQVQGSSRKWKAISWKDASSILVPYYVTDHWVAVKIDIKATSIIIYDCNINFHKEIDMDSYVRPLQDLIPRLLNLAGVETTDTWNITRPLSFPQNIGGGDGGAWVIKTIEVELARLIPYEMNNKIVDSYRPYLTACIWNKDWIL